MNRSLLEKPFEAGQIRQRKGRNGMLDYVEGHSVIARLNEALEGAWSFEITHHEVREDEVLVLGRLTADGIAKMQFGVSQVTREKGTGALVSLGDDLKAAATDALKKCATCLGVGLHLYAEKPLNGRSAATRPDGNAPPRPPEEPRRSVVAAPAPGSPSTNGHVAGDGHVAAGGTPAGNGATERQLDAIVKVALAKGLKPVDIDAMSQRAFNRKPAQLTRAEASTLIKELSNLKRQVA
jgi:hypothetical protein